METEGRRNDGFPFQGGRELFRSICEPAICAYQMYLSALTAHQRGRCTVPCREFQHKGKETLPGGCGTWAGSRWPTPPQPLIFKVTSADFMQMEAWNIQLYTERVFLYQEKRKQKEMFNVFHISIGEIITLGDTLKQLLLTTGRWRHW